MIKLAVDDKKQLLDLSVPLLQLRNPKGREAVLSSADLEELLPQIDIEGTSAVVIPLMLNFSCAYVRLTYEHKSPGRFLDTVKYYVGLQDQLFWDGVVKKYHHKFCQIRDAAKI